MMLEMPFCPERSRGRADFDSAADGWPLHLDPPPLNVDATDLLEGWYPLDILTSLSLTERLSVM